MLRWSQIAERHDCQPRHRWRSQLYHKGFSHWKWMGRGEFSLQFWILVWTQQKRPLESEFQVRNSEELRQPGVRRSVKAVNYTVYHPLCCHQISCTDIIVQHQALRMLVCHAVGFFRLALANNANGNDKGVHLAFLTCNWNVVIMISCPELPGQWNALFGSPK